MKNKLKIGDTILCVESLTEGPKKGSTYTITSINNEWIGFPYNNLDRKFYSKEIIDGKEPNWHKSCFIKIGNSKAGKILFIGDRDDN